MFIGGIIMVEFVDLINLTKEKGFEKLVVHAKGHDVLNKLGFDSLDVMMLAHSIKDKYDVDVEITGFNSFAEVLEQLNTLLK